MNCFVRSRDESHRDELLRAGATEVIPETLEAGMMIVSHALMSLEVPITKVVKHMREQRLNRYRLLRELFRGDDEQEERPDQAGVDRLCPVLLLKGSPVLGQTLADLNLGAVVITALVRNGQRILSPNSETRLEEGDVLVLFGSPDDLARAERQLLITA